MGLPRCRLVIYLMVVVGVAIGDDRHVILYEIIYCYTYFFFVSSMLDQPLIDVPRVQLTDLQSAF